jgi:NADH pyrophosphatase NudC (nudix superfamily)
MAADDRAGRVFRYCPKCGAAALRFAGPKLLHCDVCGFELYLNAAAAVAALIVDAEGRLLVVERAQDPKKGMWDLPGGFADPGESAEEALRREVTEELDLEVTSLRYLGSFPNVYDYMGVRYATMDLGFVCEVADTKAVRPHAAEVAAVSFKRPDEIEAGRFAFESLSRLVELHLATGPAS